MKDGLAATVGLNVLHQQAGRKGIVIAGLRRSEKADESRLTVGDIADGNRGRKILSAGEMRRQIGREQEFFRSMGDRQIDLACRIGGFDADAHLASPALVRHKSDGVVTLFARGVNDRSNVIVGNYRAYDRGMGERKFDGGRGSGLDG